MSIRGYLHGECMLTCTKTPRYAQISGCCSSSACFPVCTAAPFCTVWYFSGSNSSNICRPLFEGAGYAVRMPNTIASGKLVAFRSVDMLRSARSVNRESKLSTAWLMKEKLFVMTGNKCQLGRPLFERQRRRRTSLGWQIRRRANTLFLLLAVDGIHIHLVGHLLRSVG